MKMKRPETNGAGKAIPAVFVDHSFKSEYPNIHEYISCDKWDDGKFRKTSTLLFFVDEGCMKLCLNDRALEKQAFISARTFTEALTLLDEGLEQDNIVWRANRPNGKK